MPPLIVDNLWRNQERAVRNLEISLAEGRRRALIQMATGSWKTFTAANISYRLIKHARFNRILFLVDRANLGRQTKAEFDNFSTPDDGRKFSELYNVQHLTHNKADHVSRVTISTIQRIYSILRGEAEMDPTLDEMTGMEVEPTRPVEVSYNPSLPPEFFDLIIVDECHRSIYGVWRQVLEYFDATIVGLTATPSKQTFGFFDGNLVMEYPRELAPSRARQLVQSGDTVLSTVRTYLKNTAMVLPHLDGATASTGFSVLRPKPHIDPRFLFHRVLENGFVNQLSERQTGTSYPAVRERDVRTMSVAVPALPEQQRIVEVIEEQFSRLDAGHESLQRAKRNLVGLRSSLLEAEIGRGWPFAKLEALVSDLRYGTSVKCSYEGFGVPVLRIPNVRNGRIDTSDLKRAQSRELDLASASVRAGDLLFIRTNGSRELIGTVGLVDPASAGLAFASYLIRARPTSGVVPSFLQMALASPQLRAEIMRRAATSAGRYNISARSLGTLDVPLPPIDEQRRIVAEVDRQFSIIDSIAKNIDAGLARASTLRQSILSQAFSGKLTAAA